MRESFKTEFISQINTLWRDMAVISVSSYILSRCIHSSFDCRV